MWCFVSPTTPLRRCRCGSNGRVVNVSSWGAFFGEEAQFGFKGGWGGPRTAWALIGRGVRPYLECLVHGWVWHVNQNRPAFQQSWGLGGTAGPTREEEREEEEEEEETMG
eukprot:4516365-Pyramimonas_sp.AAC.2